MPLLLLLLEGQSWSGKRRGEGALGVGRVEGGEKGCGGKTDIETTPDTGIISPYATI